MIPPVSNPVWEQLVTGQKVIKSSNLAFNMHMYSLRLQYKTDPSPASVAKLADHARQFVIKFADSLKPEMAALFN